MNKKRTWISFELKKEKKESGRALKTLKKNKIGKQQKIRGNSYKKNYSNHTNQTNQKQMADQSNGKPLARTTTGNNHRLETGKSCEKLGKK